MKTSFENNVLNFRHWLTEHESLLLGASLGFFHSGPIGLVIGAWLGNYIGEKIHTTTQHVQHATHMVQPIVAPISFASNKLQNLWHFTQNCYRASKDRFSNKEQPKTQDTQKADKADKGQPKLIQDIQKTDKGQLTVIQDSQEKAQTHNPSLTQTAADLLDMMNGHADESTFEQYEDSWLTRDASELPSLVINQFRGLTQRFWSQPAAQPNPSPAQVESTKGPRAALN